MRKIEIDAQTKAILIQAAATLCAGRSARLPASPVPRAVQGMADAENAKLPTALKEVIAAFDAFDALREGIPESLIEEVLKTVEQGE